MKGDFFMKKFVYPLVYIAIAIFMQLLFGIVYRNFYHDIHIPRDLIPVQIITTVISFIAPIFLGIVFYPFRAKRPLLLLIPTIMVLMGILNVIMMYSQIYLPQTITVSIIFFVNIFAIGIIVVLILLGLTEEWSTLLKLTFLIVGGLRFVFFLLGNNITLQLIVRVLSNSDAIQRYMTMIRSFALIEMTSVAVIIFFLYRELENEENTLIETDRLTFESPSFEMDQ